MERLKQVKTELANQFQLPKKKNAKGKAFRDPKKIKELEKEKSQLKK